MSEQTPGAKPETQTPSETPSEEPKTVSYEEYDLLKRKHDSAFHELRQANKNYEKLEKDFESFKTEADPKKKEDLKSELENAHNRIKALQEESTTYQNKFRDVAVKQEVRSAFQSKLVEDPNGDPFETFWKVAGENFDFVQDPATGKERVGIKGQSYYKMEEWFDKEFAPRNGFLVRNQGKPGAGVPEKPGQKTSHETMPSVDDLKKMGKTQRIQTLAKHPDLQKAWTGSTD